MNASWSFLFFFRRNMPYNNSVAKIEVSDGHHWLSKAELTDACVTGNPLPVSAMVDRTFSMLNVRDPKTAKGRFLGRKQVFLNGTDLSLDELAAIGWNTRDYPMKYGVRNNTLRDVLLDDARKTGVNIDAGNEISHLTAPAFKCLINLLEQHGIPQHLYLDSGSLDYLAKIGAKDTLDLLCQRMEHPTAACEVIKVPDRCTADARMLGHADQTGGHVCSQDMLDDWDMIYDWILHGCEHGWPRIHKICVSQYGDMVGIPDFGLWAKIPSAF